MAKADCVVVGLLVIVPAIPLLPPCKDVMDRTIIAYNSALTFESYCAGSLSLRAGSLVRMGSLDRELARRMG